MAGDKALPCAGVAPGVAIQSPSPASCTNSWRGHVLRHLVGVLCVVCAWLHPGGHALSREVKLLWTNPGTQAACGDSVATPEVMGAVHFRVVRVPHPDTLTLTPKNVAGRVGPDSILVSLADSVRYAEFIVWSVDAAGNRSCGDRHYLWAGFPDTTTATLARVEQQFWTGNFGSLIRTEWPETVDMDSTGASYSVRWLGNLEVPPGGVRLYMVHDDAARLYVDGVWVTTQSSCTDAQNVQAWDVSAGVRAIRLDYVNCGSPARCRLEWDGPSIVRQTINAEAWK